MAEADEWTVVGRNNRPRRPPKPAAADAPAGDAAPAAAPASAAPLPHLPGWGASATGTKRRSPPTADGTTTTTSHKRTSHQQQQQQQRPGRRRERWPSSAAAAADRSDEDNDDDDNPSRERRCALHLSLVREAAAEVARSDMYRSLRAAMASAGGEGGEMREDSGDDNATTPGFFPWSSVSELVVYGLGSVEGSRVSRHQAALATLLASPEVLPRVAERAAAAAARAEAGAGSAAATAPATETPPNPLPRGGGLVAYDPCFSRVDRELLARLGAEIPKTDERCARRAARPAAFFFLPHLEAPLTEALLEANWTRPRLRRTAILGNAFSLYAERWASAPSLVAGGARSGGAHAPPRRLLALVAAGAVTERRVREGGYGVASAFNDAALHTFTDASDAAWEAAGVPDEVEDDEEEGL